MMPDSEYARVLNMEKLYGKPSGMGKVYRGECELKARSSARCTVCPCGHLMECHWPHTCKEAGCSHYIREREV